jgi:hypothetical protein
MSSSKGNFLVGSANIALGAKGKQKNMAINQEALDGAKRQ